MTNTGSEVIIFIKAVPVMIAIQRGGQKVIKQHIHSAILFLLVVLAGSLSAQDQEITCRINYLSKDNVYVDRGEENGLRVGDTLHVGTDGNLKAVLVILHTSGHSASCKILSQQSLLQVGDMAVRAGSQKTGNEIIVAPLVTQEIRQQRGAVRKNIKSWARVSGALSLQWYHLEDLSGNQLDFDQPTIRFNLKALELWGKGYNLKIMTRLRKNIRARTFSTGSAQEEYRNRIYTFSFSYDDPNAAINFAVGRIHANQLSGVGYLDGLFLTYNYSPRLYFGVYGGLKSSWQFAGAEQSRQKYGVLFGYRSDRNAPSRLETSLALNTEYNGKTVSRENLYMQSSLILANRLFIFNSLDLDINRAWRKAKTGEDISLSAFYLSARYRFSDQVMAGLAFDDRKNYYTYETMEIPFEFYDMAARYGIRADLDLNFRNGYSASFQAGIRLQENNTEKTYNSRASFIKNNLFIKRLAAGARVSYYTNAYTEGWIPTLFISKSFSAGHYLSLNGGLNMYRLSMLDQQRQNYWMRLNSLFYLWSGLYLSGHYNYDWGDDREGYNFAAEIGYRF